MGLQRCNRERGISLRSHNKQRIDSAVIPEDFDYSASISMMDVRENLPFVDPENLSSQDVLEVLLHLFRQKPGFVDRGHEINNKETAWVNAFLFRLKPGIDHDGMEAFVVEVIGSSVDRMANLR
ncbi:MAG: hypothetical protein ACJ0GY_02195 [Synechococcus sp.]|uniref:hypothetical protein n=1 Tax=Synechococcus sp. PROS-9-1 TaxID=1968775 RepID=UPI00210272DA|nr:hypothetical protein [Synechococcus sp. PROS-9-1]|tara:strand:+ start:575 stop:946 length:372 start_codon:yes stop_codon:yes gene_type:complete